MSPWTGTHVTVLVWASRGVWVYICVARNMLPLLCRHADKMEITVCDQPPLCHSSLTRETKSLLAPVPCGKLQES